MLILRIKRCETALKGGRLDEALELLRATDLRAHRRGQALTDRLIAALTERSRQHLAAGRFGPAGDDCRKAELLAGNSAEIVQLRAAIDRAAGGEREAFVRRERAAAAARRLVEQGQLTLGRDFAARTDDADALVADIDDRRSIFDRCLSDATAAIEREDWEAAVTHLARAKSLRPGCGDIHALTKTVSEHIATEADRLIVAGRLDAAGLLLRRVGTLCASHTDLQRIRRGLDQCRVAWQLLDDGRHREAGEVLGRLSHVWPNANWLRTAAMGLARADGAIGEVRSGPLGLLDADETMALPNHRSPAPPPLALAAPIPRAVGRRFLLHVDGAGSSLVLQESSISIGPVSASAPPDLPLMTSANAPRVTLMRSDEDYFLSAPSLVPVNDKAVSSKLLVTGDRITLGSRCRVEFARPNPASASAVLRVSGARLPWGGVRDVLLMDRELVIGPLAAAHIKTRDAGDQVVLQAGDGRLLCRATVAISIDGKPAGRIAEMTPGAQVVAGALSMVMQEIR